MAIRRPWLETAKSVMQLLHPLLIIGVENSVLVAPKPERNHVWLTLNVEDPQVMFDGLWWLSIN